MKTIQHLNISAAKQTDVTDRAQNAFLCPIVFAYTKDE